MIIDELKKYLEKTGFTVEAVLISPDLSSRQKEIKEKFPGLKIFSDYDENLFNSFNSMLCLADLSLIKHHEETTELNFEDYLKFRQGSADEPLDSLCNASLALKENAEIIFFSPEPITHKENVKKVLICGKYKNIDFIADNIVKAKKIKLIRYEFDKNRLILEQALHPELIDRIIEFSKGFYKSRGFNYRPELDRLFTKHSDYFVASRKKTSEILAVARHVWYLPGHFLPLMLATKINSEEHITLEEPGKNHYGEFTGIYKQSFSGMKANKECLITIMNYYVKNIGFEGKAFTTFDLVDQKRGVFYKNFYGFSKEEIPLRYGDFGGVWMLVSGTKDGIAQTMTNKYY